MNRAQRRAAQYQRGQQNRRGDPSAIYRVMNRLQPFTDDELRTLALPVRVAFESLRAGRGTEGDFHTLAAAINTALMRSESIDPLCEQTCITAQAALMRVLDRHQRTGLWGLDGLALQDIPLAIDLHEQLLQLSTPLQMQQAMQETLRRMQAGQVLGARA